MAGTSVGALANIFKTGVGRQVFLAKCQGAQEQEGRENYLLHSRKSQALKLPMRASAPGERLSHNRKPGGENTGVVFPDLYNIQAVR